MEPAPGPPSKARDRKTDSRRDSEPGPTVDEVVDIWGLESFPASDPPGRLPPSVVEAGEGAERRSAVGE